MTAMVILTIPILVSRIPEQAPGAWEEPRFERAVAQVGRWLDGPAESFFLFFEPNNPKKPNCPINSDPTKLKNRKSWYVRDSSTVALYLRYPIICSNNYIAVYKTAIVLSNFHT